MKNFAVFLVSISAVCATSAQGIDKQSSWYTEGALDLLKWGAYGEEVDKGALSPKAVRMVIGKRVMPSLSVEATAGFGMGSASSPSKEVKVKGVLGMYGKYTYELMPKLDIYGKAGFVMITSETAVKQPGGGTSIAATRSSGLSFGFGASYDITDKYYVGADYTFHPKAPELTGLTQSGSVSAITFFGGMRY